MPLSKIKEMLSTYLKELQDKGVLKGNETVIAGIKPAQGDKGPRYFIKGYGEKEFLRMNANNYLGMSLKKEVIEAEEKAAKEFGAGPGAVRFISGTYTSHIALEKKLAEFHNREAAMIFSSAYSAMVGILAPMITQNTIIISDELNHNCIINGIKLSRPRDKKIYKHNDMEGLASVLESSVGNCKRVIIVTDGIFSMRGDHAQLKEIADLAEKYNSSFEEGVLTFVDDSHGVGAIGETGRGTTEYTHEDRIDVLIATLGKALGVNGGYVVSSAEVIGFLRETAPFYIYSNPITPPEASAALASLEILDSDKGRAMLKHLHVMTARFESGLIDMGYEVIKGEHPVVPLMVRDTEKTTELVGYLTDNGILATGLNFPVVPKGNQEIRFQICADHTESDIDYALGVLRKYKETC
ncbi:MAG: aminotransferase class I/II-fold pyridoxal phosphate-dependent enzyme [Caldisericaceae bacterium]|nr:aminotransferase class I/II-fold pyridoxal phosphate-dependent enzyme [Caldisericaceae bacterium]